MSLLGSPPPSIIPKMATRGRPMCWEKCFVSRFKSVGNQKKEINNNDQTTMGSPPHSIIPKMATRGHLLCRQKGSASHTKNVAQSPSKHWYCLVCVQCVNEKDSFPVSFVFQFFSLCHLNFLAGPGVPYVEAEHEQVLTKWHRDTIQTSKQGGQRKLTQWSVREHSRTARHLLLRPTLNARGSNVFNSLFHFNHRNSIVISNIVTTILARHLLLRPTLNARGANVFNSLFHSQAFLMSAQSVSFQLSGRTRTRRSTNMSWPNDTGTQSKHPNRAIPTIYNKYTLNTQQIHNEVSNYSRTAICYVLQPTLNAGGSNVFNSLFHPQSSPIFLPQLLARKTSTALFRTFPSFTLK